MNINVRHSIYPQPNQAQQNRKQISWDKHTIDS